jgi:hypothetical protein
VKDAITDSSIDILADEKQMTYCGITLMADTDETSTVVVLLVVVVVVVVLVEGCPSMFPRLSQYADFALDYEDVLGT